MIFPGYVAQLELGRAPGIYSGNLGSIPSLVNNIASLSWLEEDIKGGTCKAYFKAQAQAIERPPVSSQRFLQVLLTILPSAPTSSTIAVQLSACEVTYITLFHCNHTPHQHHSGS